MYDHLNTKSRTGHKGDYINKYIWLSTKKKTAVIGLQKNMLTSVLTSKVTTENPFRFERHGYHFPCAAVPLFHYVYENGQPGFAEER